VAGIPLQNLGDELERRILRRIQKFSPDDPRLLQALIRIGITLEAEAKLNIRRKGIIDTGRLFNSIRYELYKGKDRVGVRVGSFGVPYAALHEFGGPFTDRQRRAMFASLRDRGKLGGNYTPKGVVQGGRFIGRPYLTSALEAKKGRILDIIRDVFKK